MKLPRLAFFRKARTSIRQRLALIATALAGSPRVVNITYSRAKHMVADSDAHDTDFWFDAAAAEILRWHLSDKPSGFINFHGSEWELEAHYPEGKTEGAEPVYDQEAEARILRPILADLLLDSERVYDSVDFDFLEPGELEAVHEEVRTIEDRKAAAREKFARLAAHLWD